MTLHIGVDARVLAGHHHGTRHLAYELCRAMGRLPGVRLRLFTGRSSDPHLGVDELARLPGLSVHPTGMRPTQLPQLWRWRSILRRHPVDVMFFPDHLGASPWAGPPRVVLLQNCVYETDPRFAPSRRALLAYRAATAVILRTSTVVTLSNSTGNEVERFYRRPVGARQVIGNGVEQNLRASPEMVRRLRAQFHLADGYVLHIGAQRPHRNLSMLVAAVAAVPRLCLVLVGSSGERFDDEVGRAIEHYGISDRVRRLAYVPDPLLGALYGRALLFAYPSLVEGFGRPMLEAMVVGTPVLASDVPVLREVGGDAALYAPPDDPHAWAQAITRLRRDHALRSRLTAAGAVRVANFTWSATARRLVAVCSAAAVGPAAAVGRVDPSAGGNHADPAAARGAGAPRRFSP